MPPLCSCPRDLPKSAMNIEIADDAFDGSPNVAIYAPAGSAAQTYAEAHGIPYFTYPET